MRIFLLAGTALASLALAGPASAAWDDWSVSPLTGSIDDADISYSLGGQAFGSAFSADQPGHVAKQGVTGAASLNASLQRDYDSGMSIALKGNFELYRDKLSLDNYGGDFVEKVYGQVQTGLGRVEFGMADGAAYTLAVIGPMVNGEVTTDNPDATFFVDAATGAAFVDTFELNSAVESSLNYAKISYFTPKLFGVQLGFSYTPSEGKDVVPFLNNGPNVANRQKSLWEGAINYSDSFGPITASAYAGFTVGHGDRKTPGHAGLTDWAVGTQIDWNIDDDTKLSVGGAYRQANTYTFDINQALLHGASQSLHASSVLSYGSWSVGAEFGHGTADGSLGLPGLNVHDYVADVGYAVNSNLQLSAGWQRFHYGRDIGTFFNGAPHIQMDAVFLHSVINI